MKPEDKLVVFQDKKIRRKWHDNEWYFSIVDIISVLTESVDPTAYWRKLKQRLKEEGNETVTNCHALKMPSVDGKSRLTDVGTTKEIFRLIQSIPSKKAEPFKQWLAQVGYERVEEIEDPELGQDRIKEYYELKGYPKEWIDKRLRGIAVRQELTDEWKHREIKTKKEFAILTNEISKATFGKTVGEYKDFKGLQKENLRDHMNDLELIFTMLGEASTTRIAQDTDAQGFDENKDAAREGGSVAGVAREALEKKSKQQVSTRKNHRDKQLSDK